MSEDPYDEIERMLASLFGQQVAADAVGALRASGIDPGELARTGPLGQVQRVFLQRFALAFGILRFDGLPPAHGIDSRLRRSEPDLFDYEQQLFADTDAGDTA